jgi:S-DNA-T family DNA segregation ATPase FtsK/SpoIIIE
MASSPERVGASHSHGWQEYFQLVVFFLFLALVLTVFSYHPLDPSDFVRAFPESKASEQIFGNIFGAWGANLAEWLIQILGLAAPAGLLVFALLVVDNTLLRRSPVRLVYRLAGLVQVMWFGSMLFALMMPSFSFRGGLVDPAGWIGNQSAQFFKGALSLRGTVILCLFGIAAALPLMAGVRLIELGRLVLRWVPHRRSAELAEALTEPESKLPDGAPRVPVSLGTPIMATDPRHAVAAVPRSANEPIILPRMRTQEVRPKSASMADLMALLKTHGVEGLEQRREGERQRLLSEADGLVALFETFGVSGRVVRSQPGPVVNTHEFEPAAGVKVGKVLSLQEDVALGLKAQSVLMAPQPGKSTIGVEIPAHFREVVSLREVIASEEFQNRQSPLPMVLGKTVEGKPLVADLAAMPHLLIAGATGAGKSVAINVILLSLMMSRTPDELRLILVDPKMLELSNYDGIGHLLLPVVTEPSKAAGALKWAIAEMDRRYALLKDAQVRNIDGYNRLVADGQVTEPLPYIVVVIDELCDLMMMAPKDVEDSVQRLAQKARASGIHLILATQRPSVDVLTGVIKANLPCRISFQVASRHDSRTIIETMGAEKLLGKGDMLFLPPGTSKIMRAHGAFVSDDEVNAVCRALRTSYPVGYESGVMSEVEQASRLLSEAAAGAKGSDGGLGDGELSEDDLYLRVLDFAFAAGKVSTSSIQRHFRIGYNKAARLMDRMDREGLVGPGDLAGKPREVRRPQGV